MDVILDGKLPDGARPGPERRRHDPAQKLDNVIFVGRPAFGQDEGNISIFKLLPNGEASAPTSSSDEAR